MTWGAPAAVTISIAGGRPRPLDASAGIELGRLQSAAAQEAEAAAAAERARRVTAPSSSEPRASVADASGRALTQWGGRSWTW